MNKNLDNISEIMLMAKKYISNVDIKRSVKER